jgi:acetyl-CoA C-acetyltransferase
LAGVGVDDIAHVDLYSCFPSAVQVAANELGLGLDRQLTVTGGLSFAGGPWNNYVSHSIATMLGVVRSDPGSVGLVTGNGGFLTKHSFGVYGTAPAPAGFRWDAPQDEVDAAYTPCVPAEGYAGDTAIEAYTVMHDRDGAPELGLCALRTPDGTGRTWGTTRDVDVLVAMESEEFVGRGASLDADGALTFG